MSGTNPPSSAGGGPPSTAAATARSLGATQGLKRSVQAAFDGILAYFPRFSVGFMFITGMSLTMSLDTHCARAFARASLFVQQVPSFISGHV